MKVDSDTIVKNRFWILLGLAVVLNLVAWLVMLVSVPAKVSSAEQNVTKPWKEGKDYNQFVNPDDVKAAEEAAGKAKSSQSGSWQNLYETQDAEANLKLW